MDDEDAEEIPASGAADRTKLASLEGARTFSIARATDGISISEKSTPTTESADQSAHSEQASDFEGALPQARAAVEDRRAQEKQSRLTSAATVEDGFRHCGSGSPSVCAGSLSKFSFLSARRGP